MIGGLSIDCLRNAQRNLIVFGVEAPRVEDLPVGVDENLHGFRVYVLGHAGLHQ